MIYFWRKSESLSLTSSKGLTQEQIELLQSLKVGDRLSLIKLEQVLITDPSYKIEVVKNHEIQ